MSALGDFFRNIGHALVHGPADVDQKTDSVLDLWDTLHRDTLNLVNALKDIPKFDFDPKWNSRVINVPRAIEGIREVFDIMTHGFHEKFAELMQAILTLKNALHDTVHHLPQNPEGAAIVTKIVNQVGAGVTALVAFQKAYTKVTDIAQMLDDIKRRIETLDDLFLPQGNPKKVVDEHYRKRQRS